MREAKETKMKTFKNKNFIKRDYEATNVVVCQAEESPNENWVEVESKIINEMNLMKLWIEKDIQFYGWL